MALLLDTHAVMWWWHDDRQLGRNAHRALQAASEPVFVSSVCALEIAIKHRIGKLDEFADPATRFPSLMARDGFSELPVAQAHALTAGLLAGDHRDPFDRIIAAQALAEGLTVVTRDAAFVAFGCPVLW